MAMYIYRTDGHAVGFRFSNFIHDLEGEPVGRIFGTHVYRLDGGYAGELFKDMVVSKPTPSIPAIQPVPFPAPAPPPGLTSPRRGLVNYGFPDAFHLLCEAPLAMAAE